ncbi:4'-phosphopantetheinyl transferase superfamily protein [Kitasatospora sp. NPDC056327]|uniref:4'-phosphopantetheinyl transferase superfamily protein n=1 Tax=Kitasatospora sp. NPDC056327 TaxID=3345785 RepID=UPI0035D87399
MSGAAPLVGIDVLELGELDRLCERSWFLRHCFAEEELARAERLGPGRRREYLAGRFAAKEAVLKVLGTGLLRGIAPREIAVGQDGAGRPLLRLRGRAADRAAELGLSATAVSIAHKRRTVTAVAVGRLDPAPLTPPPDPDPRPTVREEPPMDRPSTTLPHAERPAATAGTADRAVPGPAGTDGPPVVARLRLRLGQEDAHYGGGLVPGARLLGLFGDLVTEITVRTDGDEGLLAEYSAVRFTAPCRPGDYLELTARLVHRTRLRRKVEFEAYKVIAARPDRSPSAAEVLAEPLLVCTATATAVVPPPARAGRAAAPAGTAPHPAGPAAAVRTTADRTATSPTTVDGSPR